MRGLDARQIATALALIGLAAVLALLGVPVAPVALYHRLHRDAALENAVRARLYEVVARNPGITIQDSAKQAGVARTTAAYHLRILGREGLLVERPARKTVHYYRNDGSYSEEQQLRLQSLASSRTRHVAKILAERPGLQRSELAGVLGISIATVNWHLRPLLERGLLREELRGRRRLLFPTEALAESLSLLSSEREEPLAIPADFDDAPAAEPLAQRAEQAGAVPPTPTWPPSY
ncbi:MAG TPA: winged helix-turn-helix transcriptional regulator [Candidatus Thermoplasmatota archaeon]|jgi:predicted transcriptional regulator|nr:winged helix-turn-helix transcriptional regulator [Candidatus Thermoplasmatota archaeon]